MSVNFFIFAPIRRSGKTLEEYATEKSGEIEQNTRNKLRGTSRAGPVLFMKAKEVIEEGQKRRWMGEREREKIIALILRRH